MPLQYGESGPAAGDAGRTKSGATERCHGTLAKRRLKRWRSELEGTRISGLAGSARVL